MHSAQEDRLKHICLARTAVWTKLSRRSPITAIGVARQSSAPRLPCMNQPQPCSTKNTIAIMNPMTVLTDILLARRQNLSGLQEISKCLFVVVFSHVEVYPALSMGICAEMHQRLVRQLV